MNNWVSDIGNHGYKIFSQNEDDGIIQYIINNIGSVNKYCIEFGAYNGVLDSNTFNLRINHDWQALLLDRKKSYDYEKSEKKKIIKTLIKQGHSRGLVDLIHLFLAKKKSIKECLSPDLKLISNWGKNLRNKIKGPNKALIKTADFNIPVDKIENILRKFYVFQYWITAENIMSIFRKHNVPKNYDLLSIDMDGNDYWIWKAIDEEEFRANIVVIEFNSSLGPDESKVIPYSPEFKYNYDNYFGASLLAMKKLGKQKGYSLVYQNAPFNAFFVRSELVPEESRNLPILDIFPQAVPHPKLKKCPKNKKWLLT